MARILVSPLPQFFFASLTSLLLGAGSAHLFPITSILFAPCCGLIVLIGIAADNVRTGSAHSGNLALVASAAIICGPLGAITTLIVR